VPVLSAGLLLFRAAPGGAGTGPHPSPEIPAGGGVGVEVLLGHMGGPYWARKDDGAWSIPKGEHDPDEDPRAAAEREFTEELGSAPPAGESRELGTVPQRGGRKQITVFAREADFDADAITPGTFDLEWPPRSGKVRSFPEIDRAAWFGLDVARVKLVAAQVEFLDRLAASLS